ncbi:MAG: DinB family protein [Anaerolineales bacterium]|nr:DinB family protein [Anaerolineales bacterium]
MAYIVCAEENQNLWIAHAPDLPGCFASNVNREPAIQAIPLAIDNYLDWCKKHGIRIMGLSAPMIVSEVIRSWEFEDGHIVNAFFASDRPPLVGAEIKEFKLLLEATYADLLASVEDIEPADASKVSPGERWSIEGILEHVARSEWWYLDRLGLAFPRDGIPADAKLFLREVHAHMLVTLPELHKRGGVVVLAGETWSARKILRRSLWHRRDHTAHITRLRARLR